jgi:hypothetical protein
LQSEFFSTLAHAQFSFTAWAASLADMPSPGESSAQLLLYHAGMQRVPSPKLKPFILRDFFDE